MILADQGDKTKENTLINSTISELSDFDFGVYSNNKNDLTFILKFNGLDSSWFNEFYI